MDQISPVPGQMPQPTTLTGLVREHRAYIGTTASAGTLLVLGRIWNAQGAEHSVGAAALMLAFGAASGYFATRIQDETAEAVFASGALVFGALAVDVYSAHITPALIIWVVAVIASCVLIARSHREDHRVATAHAHHMETRRLERGVDLSIAQVTTSAQIEVARQQTETAAALEAALAHRAALDAGGAVDPIAMLRATGQLPELTVVRDDAERRTA